MSIDFSQLQQSINRLLLNSSQSISKLKELSIDPARDVQIQYYDQNGNLQTITTPNLMKVLNTVQTNINSYMQKTVYVDQVNGNDNNDGTQTRPFKTLQKAFDSVPVGGSVTVNLLSDVHLSSFVLAANKYISIHGNNNVIYAYYGKDGSYNNMLGKMILSRSSIIFNRVKITFLESTTNPLDPNLPYAGHQFLARQDIATINFCSLFNCELNLSKFSFANSGGGGTFNSTFLHLYGTKINLLDNSSKLLTGGGIIVLLNGGGNTLPSGVSWADLISGIVRDSNGVPRNVISNVIL